MPQRTKIFYIYEIKNIQNGKTYVGKHETFSGVKDNYFGSGVALRNAIQKYGIENFQKTILDFAENKTDLCKKEKWWIAKYKSERKAEYNLTNGGEGGDTLKLRSKEDNLKRSEKLKAVWTKDFIQKRNSKTAKTWESKTQEELRNFRKNHSKFLYATTINPSELYVLSDIAKKYNVSLQTPRDSAVQNGKL